MSQDLNIVALLPMKKNSTRVKGKNFREFHGKPLFKWVLDALEQVDIIGKIVINTDAIATLQENGLADSNRIICRERSQKIRGDEVSMNRIIKDDIDNVKADIYLMTHTTNPLLKSETVKKALETFIEKTSREKYDSLFTVNRRQTRLYDRGGKAINHDPNNLIPTQDLEPLYEENSNLYIFTAESFENSNARIGLRPYMYEMDDLESIDIDTETDWKMAEITANYFLDKK